MKKDNIPILEELLHHSGQEFLRLEEMKEEDKLNFGEVINKKDLPIAFSEVKGIVHDFLGVSEVKAPRIEGYKEFFNPNITDICAYTLIPSGLWSMNSAIMQGDVDSLIDFAIGLLYFKMGIDFLINSISPHYNRIDKSLRISKFPEAESLPTYGHEYTHHIQDKFKFPDLFSRILCEGHAIGVQRKVSTELHQRRDNEAFMYGITKRDAREYKSAYLWICNKLNVPTNKHLLKDLETVYVSLLGPHAKGNTLFSIAEARFGTRIYRDLLHGEFDFSEF